MRYVLFKKCLAVLSVLALTATGLWAAGEEEGSTATAADKKYVTDPTTGKVVVAPEYGGTLTFSRGPGSPAIDPYFGHPGQGPTDGVAEKLGIMNWGSRSRRMGPENALPAGHVHEREAGGELGYFPGRPHLHLPHPPGRSLA